MTGLTGNFATVAAMGSDNQVLRRDMVVINQLPDETLGPVVAQTLGVTHLSHPSNKDWWLGWCQGLTLRDLGFVNRLPFKYLGQCCGDPLEVMVW